MNTPLSPFRSGPKAPSKPSRQKQFPSSEKLPEVGDPVHLILDVQKISGKTQEEVEALLGRSTVSEVSEYGAKKSYKNGGVEIVFIEGKADWITINGLDEIPFSPNAIESLGLESSRPSFASDFVLRWVNTAGLKHAAIFKGRENCSYAYIKVSTE